MKEELDDLSVLWQQARDKSQHAASAGIVDLIREAKTRKRKAIAAHFGNAGILTATIAVLVFYFYYLYNFQDVLSKVGYNLMIGGLAIRVLIELFSVWYSRKINVADAAAKSLAHSISFYEFRKQIHGPVTVIIFVLYFIGFYMLTPEFSRHISTPWLLLIDVSALFIAAFLAFFIRKGIRQELTDLEKMMALQRSLAHSE